MALDILAGLGVVLGIATVIFSIVKSQRQANKWMEEHKKRDKTDTPEE